jgi:hypothetical protein
LDSLIGKGSALYEGVEEFMVRSMDGKLEFPYSFELVVPKGGGRKGARMSGAQFRMHQEVLCLPCKEYSMHHRFM